jgi:hypothetical protein
MCEGRGRLLSLRPCSSCGGDPATGAKGRGYLVIDDYTGQQVGTAETEARAMMIDVRCDRCAGAGRTDGARLLLCVRCGGTGRVATSDARRIDALLRPRLVAEDAEGFMLDQLDRRDQAGSYVAVDRALHMLLAQSPRAWRTVVAVHVERRVKVEALTPMAEVLLDHGLAFVEARVPKPIRLPAHLERPLVNGRPKRRWEAVEALLEEGLPIAEVIRRSGLSRSRVYELRARWEADRVQQAEAAA